MKDLEQYTDEQIINGIVNNDHSMIEYFFFKKCKSLFAYIIQSVFDYQIDENTLISELYIYLQFYSIFFSYLEPPYLPL